MGILGNRGPRRHPEPNLNEGIEGKDETDGEMSLSDVVT